MVIALVVSICLGTVPTGIDLQAGRLNARQAAILRSFPEELWFVKTWRLRSVSTLSTESYVPGLNPKKIIREYDHFSFEARGILQAVARKLKERLTPEMGWKLNFPQVGSYSARATRVNKQGKDDLMLEYIAYQNPTIMLWDKSRPVRERSSHTE